MILFTLFCLMLSLNEVCAIESSIVYDFIVVGSGPTGATTAVRLARRGYKVLLMEAGSDYYSKDISNPAFYFNATEDKNIAWDFYVKHYPENTGLRQKVLYPRVTGLGGCSLHNTLIHIYPNERDFEEMVALTGDNGWSEKNMRKYYYEITGKSNEADSTNTLDVENNQANSNSVTNSNSMENISWLPLSYFNVVRILSLDLKLLDIFNNVLLGSLKQSVFGYDINEYKDSKLATSFESDFLIPMNLNTKDLTRTGIRDFLVLEARINANLDIWTNVFVTKIILDQSNNAIGVSYKKGYHFYEASEDSEYYTYLKTQTKNVYSNLEVIVSAGAFNTPQLIMLSGIGDSSHLEKFGIKTKVHLPGVGLNLQDRYEISINYRFDKEFSLLKDCYFKYNDKCYEDYEKYRIGAYTFNGVLTGNLIKSSPNLTEPDVFTLTAPVYFTGYRKGITEDLLQNKNVFTFVVLKAHSKNNFGTVKLQSKVPWFTPDINFNYFSKDPDNNDLKALVKGLRRVRQIAKKFSGNVTEILPGIEVQTDDQLYDYIRKTTWGHHACCSMKIGNDNDKLSVLDNYFRVRGANRLRVADMSIFNKIPGYFPALYLYMSGYKIADKIADYYDEL